MGIRKKNGRYFRVNSQNSLYVRFKYLARQPSPISMDLANTCSDAGLGDWENDEDEQKTIEECVVNSELEMSCSSEQPVEENLGVVPDQDIKEIVETVKNAVLNYRNVEQEHGVIGDNLKTNLSNANVISNVKNASCDKLGSAITELDNKFENMSLKSIDEPSTSKMEETTTNTIELNQVNLNSESEKEDDNLHMYNSYNYWYIRPEMPLDLSIIEDCRNERGKTDDNITVSN